MKKNYSLKIVIFSLVLLLAVVNLSFASVSKNEIYKEVITTQSINKVHRIVTGTTLSSQYNNLNFYDRFIDGQGNAWFAYGTNQYSQQEIDFMKTIYCPQERVNYYVDLTRQTYKNDGGLNFYKSKSRTDYHSHKTNLSWVYPNESKILSIETTEITFEDIDSKTISITEHNLITKENTIYQITDYYCESPLVLDIDKNKKIDTAKNIWLPHAPKFFTEHVRTFDITGDGSINVCEWIAPGAKDAFLVMPKNGAVKSALQLFGTAGGYEDGYEKLSIVCDKDKNGWVEGEELEELALWIDSNSDAQCQPEELKSLQSCGVNRISVYHKNYEGVYKSSEGRYQRVWDWWPTMAVTRKFRN